MNSDLVAINRQFLVMARETAKSKSAEIITGLSRSVLDRLSSLSLEQVEGIAQGIGISLISFRLTEAELNRLISLQDAQRAAYPLAVMASAER